MTKKASISAADMQAVFGHALVEPKAKTGEGPAEERAAAALGVTILGAITPGSQPLPAVRTFRVRDAQGKAAALVMPSGTLTPPERDRFAGAVSVLYAAGEVTGVLAVHATTDDHDAFLTDLWTTGTSRDLSALKWSQAKRVEFVGKVARSLERLHAAGLTHGSLCADNVLLDDDLEPVLSEAGLVDVRALLARREAGPYEAYVSPETRGGADADVLADVYALGKLLQTLADGGEKSPAAAGLGEIVQRCVSPPLGRYGSMTEVAEAIEKLATSLADQAPLGVVATEPRGPRTLPRAPAATPEAGASTFADGPLAEKKGPWVPPRALGLTGLGIAVVGVVGGGFAGGNLGVRTGMLVLATLGSAIATTLAPPLPAAERLVRLSLALGVAGLVGILNPASLVARLVARVQIGGGETSRSSAIESILANGRDFRGISLSGVDLSNRDLTGADLRGVNLRGANLSGAQVTFAEVDGADFDGANLHGTNLTGTPLQVANVGSASCDADTMPPEGYKCDAGHFARNRPGS